MKLDYCLLSVAAIICICHFGDSNSQRIDGTDDVANVGRDFDLYFLDDEDSREAPQQPLNEHHLSKREAPLSRRASSTKKAASKKEASFAETLMGSGDSEASEDTEDSSKVLKHPESDDEDEDDIEGSGDIFAVSKTTKRPRVNTPPPIRGEVQSFTTTTTTTPSTTTEKETTTPSTTTSTTTSTTAIPTTMRTPSSSRRPPIISTTSIPEDDEDSEDDGDYEGSGAGELPISKGSVNPARTNNKEKPKAPVDDYTGGDFTDDDDDLDDDDDDDDDDDIDDDLEGGDLLSTPRSVSASTGSPSTPTGSSSSSSPSSTTDFAETTTEFATTTQASSSTSSTTSSPDKDDDSTGDDDDDTDDDDTIDSEEKDIKDSDVKHNNNNSKQDIKPIIPEKPNKQPPGGDSRESNENAIDHEHDEDNKINVGEGLLERHKATPRPSTLLGQPGILVAIMGGAVVGLLLAILCVMFVVYRMRKKDEGSYPLNKRTHDDHFSTHRRNYMRPSANKEFYA